jgi:hypothetical protein
MEQQKLLARWHILLTEPSTASGLRDVLEERLVILHRLNELGVNNIEGLPIVKALEATNELVRKNDKTARLPTATSAAHL